MALRSENSLLINTFFAEFNDNNNKSTTFDKLSLVDRFSIFNSSYMDDGDGSLEREKYATCVASEASVKHKQQASRGSKAGFPARCEHALHPSPALLR